MNNVIVGAQVSFSTRSPKEKRHCKIAITNFRNKIQTASQYIVNDMEQLNSSVIRVFKTHYPIGYYPVMDDIVNDEVEFHAHTVLKFGIVYNAWYKVGQSKEIGNFKNILFKSSRDDGDSQIEISERWDVWHINEPSVYVGKLTKEHQQAEQGSVMPYIAIIERLKYGKYTHSYPGY